MFQSTDLFLHFYYSQIISYPTCVRNGKKLRVTTFVSEIKTVENYPDFEKLVYIIHHGLQGHIIKISKVSEQRQTI